jgi:hypothetical protein
MRRCEISRAPVRVQARPREVAPLLWHQFVQDCLSFMHYSADNWAGRAASLGWDQFSLFGCSRQRPVLDLGCAGLLWVLRGGQILRLYRDWAEYLQAGTSHTYHRRRVEPLPTGRPCGEPASLIVSRFGQPFNLCARCALSEYRRQRRPPNGYSALSARRAVSPTSPTSSRA